MGCGTAPFYWAKTQKSPAKMGASRRLRKSSTIQSQTSVVIGLFQETHKKS